MVNEVIPGQFYLRAGRIDQATDRLRDVVIYDLTNGHAPPHHLRRQRLHALQRRPHRPAPDAVRRLHPRLRPGAAGGLPPHLLPDRLRAPARRLEPLPADRRGRLPRRPGDVGVRDARAHRRGDARRCSPRPTPSWRWQRENDVRALLGVAPRHGGRRAGAPRRCAVAGLYCRRVLPRPRGALGPVARADAGRAAPDTVPRAASPAAAPGRPRTPPRTTAVRQQREVYLANRTATRAPSSSGCALPGGDPQEARHPGDVHRLRADRRAPRPAVPARRRGPRHRRERAGSSASTTSASSAASRWPTSSSSRRSGRCGRPTS